MHKIKRREFIFKSAGVAAASLTYSQLYSRVQREIENPPAENKFDVIVLGVGSMGSSACYHLAKKGYRVLGLEQFDIPHEQGSHAGQSRLIRKAYGEHSDYVPLLDSAYAGWRDLEAITGSQVYFKTGLAYFGAQDDAFLKVVKESSEKYNIPVSKLTAAELSKKYPQFKVPRDFQQLEEPDAGFVTPERAVLLYTEQAIKKGTVIRTKEKVLEWKRINGTVIVKTNSGVYEAKKLVITAGPWAGKMIPGYAPKLTVTRQAVAWVKPTKWDDFVLGKFPCWIFETKGYDFYGFPILPVGNFGGPTGLKLALHYPGGDVTDPDAVNRNTKQPDLQVLIDFMKEFIPGGYEDILAMKTCLYTNSPDGHFIIDYLKGYDKDVAIATGFSGHGFKFASVVGEIMADLAIDGSTKHPIGFLNANRFA